MDALITIIATVGLAVALASFFVIRHAARRPANGELKTLAALERKIVSNQVIILRNFQHCKITV